jgi:CheY-like chemotaxis protein
MDVQMPVMDGLAAAREIRRRETGGARRVPIIALTASAMTDELERCTAAGMDGLLAKPLELTRLRETLERHGMRTDGASVAASGAAMAATQLVGEVMNPLDLEQLRTIVGEDEDFMQQLCETFVSSSLRIVEELTRALLDGDRAVLASLAHKLKGGSASVCAHQLSKLAAALERDAKDKSLPDLEQSVAALRHAFGAAADYVAAEVA